MEMKRLKRTDLDESLVDSTGERNSLTGQLLVDDPVQVNPFRRGKKFKLKKPKGRNHW